MTVPRVILPLTHECQQRRVNAQLLSAYAYHLVGTLIDMRLTLPWVPISGLACCHLLSIFLLTEKEEKVQAESLT